MKREMDLIRALLFAVEDDSFKPGMEIVLVGFTEEQIDFHSYLLVDAGLALGASAQTRGTPYKHSLICLTWAGADFLDDARNDSVWNKVKQAAKEKGTAFGFDVLKQALQRVVRVVAGLEVGG